MRKPFLGDEIIEGRVHRLPPIRRTALPEPPREADTVIQQIRWEVGARDHAIAEWDEEDAMSLDSARVDGVEAAHGVPSSEPLH